MNSSAEWDLIEACRSGTRSAFEPLVRRHEGPGLGFASVLLGDEDEAADALQDAFVLAYRALHRLDRGRPFGPWFRTILRNVCLDRLRSPRVKRGVRLRSAALDGAVWSEPEAERRVRSGEIADHVGAALRTLPEDQRATILLREVEGLSYAEIAAALGVPMGTVASRLNHGRAALKEVLLSRGIGMEDLL